MDDLSVPGLTEIPADNTRHRGSSPSDQRRRRSQSPPSPSVEGNEGVPSTDDDDLHEVDELA
jgi:hypothetical protein